MKEQASFIAWRFYLLITIILLISIGLIIRVIDLAIFKQNFLRERGDERALRLTRIPAYRGMILDRHGAPLAVSTLVYSVWCNPQEINVYDAALNRLSEKLQVKKIDLITSIQHYQQRGKSFAYIKRGLAPQIAKDVKQFAIPGIYLQPEYKRFYPEGEVMAHVIGMTNIDDQGQEGVELAYNDWLAGQPGQKWVTKDRLGRTISDVKTVQAQRPGRDLTLSIDKRIQYLAYRELLNGVVENQAESGSAIVLDAKSGEILAMVNQPSFNPNNRETRNAANFRNRAVTDSFEPGSTIKAFSVASALDSGLYQPNSIINTYPGWMRIGHNVVHDESNNGKISIARILQISSNMGITKIMLNLPKDQLWNLLRRLGFGEITGIGFPGEQSGTLMNTQNWGDFKIATLSFGYGLTVTTLQLVRAYAVLANDGIKLPVSLLKRDELAVGKRVIDKRVAHEMLQLLENVMNKGATGEFARVPGYRVAGKTGTAKMVGLGGYQHRYIASFVGIAPMQDPRLVVVVVINDPQGKSYYGKTVAGPIFSKIMLGALHILDIPPDDTKG